MGLPLQDPIERMLQEAAQNDRANQQLQQVLQTALHAPIVVKQITGPCLMGMVDNGDRQVLLVALPNGERWDIPLDPQNKARLLATAAGGTADAPGETPAAEAPESPAEAGE